MVTKTFIVDCPRCKAKVAAEEKGRAERNGFDHESEEPYGERLLVGVCPSCNTFLAGESRQIGFEGYDSEDEQWSDVVRVYPKTPSAFSSARIQNVVRDSFVEADLSLQ